MQNDLPYDVHVSYEGEDSSDMAPIKDEEADAAAAQRARLADSLSASYPCGALSKAFNSLEQNYDPDGDPLSSSCFAELSLEKGRIDEDSDDELTSLTWLQDTDLLRNIKTGDHGLCSSPMEVEGDLQKENDANLTNSGIYGIPHPPHVPYNPQKHVNSKPPYSFSCLIFMAVEDSPDKKLPVKDIYNWILTHFPYFQNAPTGWKNSVRHNLSLNKCFKKVEKDRCSNIGKGSLWMIDPDFRPNLLQALRKTPYHPYHQLQMFNNSPSTNNVNYSLLNGGDKPLPLRPKYVVNSPSPHLFPFLSKRLAQSNSYDSSGSSPVSASDIDVANTLVSLKRAAESRRTDRHSGSSPRSRSPSPPEFGSEREKELLRHKKLRPLRSESPIVCYALPSDDHTYSITQEMIQTQDPHDSPESSIDEEYEFGTNDKTLSELDDVYSESDYDEEGWSEEEELYNKEKQKRMATSHPTQPHHHHHHHNTRTLTANNNNNNTINHHQHKTFRQVPTSRQPSSQRPKNKQVQPQVLPQVPAPAATTIEEDLRLAEGANALLNLAGIKTAHIVPLRSISPSGGGGNNNNNGAMLTKGESSDSGVTGVDTSMDSVKEDDDLDEGFDGKDPVENDSGDGVENLAKKELVGMEKQREDVNGEDDGKENEKKCGKVSPLMVITSIKMEKQDEDEPMET